VAARSQSFRQKYATPRLEPPLNVIYNLLKGAIDMAYPKSSGTGSPKSKRGSSAAASPPKKSVPAAKPKTRRDQVRLEKLVAARMTR
jgi:hypothetical protein